MIPVRIRVVVFALMAAVPLLFVVAPIGTSLVMSFWRVDSGVIVPDFTTDNYTGFFGNPSYFRTFLGTLWLCVRVTGVGILVGYPIAWFIWRRGVRMRSFLLLSFDETLISVFLAGNETTLPLRLWAMMRVGFTPEINALVTLILGFSILLAIIVSLRLKPTGEQDE